MPFKICTKRTWWITISVMSLSSCAHLPSVQSGPKLLSIHDRPETVVQVCLPDKTVLYQDVEIDLTGIPKARTTREMQAANGKGETGRSAYASIEDSLTDPDLCHDSTMDSGVRGKSIDKEIHWVWGCFKETRWGKCERGNHQPVEQFLQQPACFSN